MSDRDAAPITATLIRARLLLPWRGTGESDPHSAAARISGNLWWPRSPCARRLR